MAAKQLVFAEDARRKLRNGMNVVANAVGATLGPKGRNVSVDRKFGSPTITHDGVSVAKEIELEDPFENMGAQLLKEAATKTNDIAGDGTTTSTVLAHAIVNEGLTPEDSRGTTTIAPSGMAEIASSTEAAIRGILSSGHSGARQRREPGIHNHETSKIERPVVMGPGLRVPRGPGTTS